MCCLSIWCVAETEREPAAVLVIVMHIFTQTKHTAVNEPKLDHLFGSKTYRR